MSRVDVTLTNGLSSSFLYTTDDTTFSSTLPPSNSITKSTGDGLIFSIWTGDKTGSPNGVITFDANGNKISSDTDGTIDFVGFTSNSQHKRWIVIPFQSIPNDEIDGWIFSLLYGSWILVVIFLLYYILG